MDTKFGFGKPVDLGFDESSAMAWRVDTSRNFDSGEEKIAYFQSIVAGVGEVAGVEGVVIGLEQRGLSAAQRSRHALHVLERPVGAESEVRDPTEMKLSPELELQPAPYLSKEKITERMAVSTDEAWDVEGTEKGLEPDPNRKPEIIWKELVDQRLDMTEVNKTWLDDYKKKYNIK